MPTLTEARQADLSGYTTVEAGTSPMAAPQMTGEQPAHNTMLRCPLPLHSVATPDSLRQFYKGGMVPQSRFLSPQSLSSVSGNTTVNQTVIAGGGGGSGSGGGYAPVPVPAPASVAVQRSITSGPLGPGDRFAGVLSTSRSFQLLMLTASVAVRIQLYGSKTAQALDAGRPLDVGPSPGTTQNILCDIVLDTAPFQWSFQNLTGANADTPQNAQMYATITNLGASSNPVTVTAMYVPLELS